MMILDHFSTFTIPAGLPNNSQDVLNQLIQVTQGTIQKGLQHIVGYLF